MTSEAPRVTPTRRQDSLQWRVFYLTLGLGLGTGILAALFALTIVDMLNPPNLRLWAAVIGVSAVAGFAHYMIFKLALRRQFERFLGQFYGLLGQPAPRLAPIWQSTELDDIDALFAELIRELRDYIDRSVQREADLRRLQRYFSPSVVASIGAGVDAPMRMTVTVLFCDIRGFTPLSESLPPDELVGLLNDYFTAVIDIIYREDGTVLKLIGDGVMAVFGAPVSGGDDAERAARVARQLPAAFNRVATAWAARTGRPLPRGIGVGLASGEVVVGNIGSPHHLDYTIIGDTVNIASRLSGAARAGQVLATALTAARLSEAVPAQPLGAIAVKGKEEPVAIAEIPTEPARIPAIANGTS